MDKKCKLVSMEENELIFEVDNERNGKTAVMFSRLPLSNTVAIAVADADFKYNGKLYCDYLSGYDKSLRSAIDMNAKTDYYYITVRALSLIALEFRTLVTRVDDRTLYIPYFKGNHNTVKIY